jgi:hypothetical protein
MVAGDALCQRILETQKKVNVADSTVGIGIRFSNHLVRFPPSVVVPDRNSTLELRQFDKIRKLMKTIAKILVTEKGCFSWRVRFGCGGTDFGSPVDATAE